ncbi:hypothetical protein P154DRAFT_516646 [Amniculicola lignicola CBS 123094]|uniref:Uncharacterized protein n=1 Tax=Amniculicola lignicola CBS 123094 TaxID=1392246 RepID=A0A6A5X4J2_9PLEO|nr:hypothetical protein P154DRAFT_516646 [Amniculicola lignicola CBS 123094]
MVHEAFQLLRKATSSQARQAAGHNEEQWRRFIIITREAAQVIVHEHSDWTWPQVPFQEKEKVQAGVNARLAEERIPEVGTDVLRWRMSHALGTARQASRLTHQENASRG